MLIKRLISYVAAFAVSRNARHTLRGAHNDIIRVALDESRLYSIFLYKWNKFQQIKDLCDLSQVIELIIVKK